MRAETLNQQFQSVFSDGKTYLRDDFDQRCKMEKKDLPELETIHITEEEMKRLLAGLDPRKASGPDGISARVPNKLSSEIAPILTTIYHLYHYQTSITTGEVLGTTHLTDL